MQIQPKALMQAAVAVPAAAQATAANDASTAAPAADSWMDSGAVLAAVAVLVVGTGLACAVDASSARVLLATMLRAGTWAYTACLLVAAVLTAACLGGQQPRQQQQQPQQAEKGVQRVQEGHCSCSAGTAVSLCSSKATPHSANCFQTASQACSCNDGCSPFELQAPAAPSVPASCTPSAPGCSTNGTSTGSPTTIATGLAAHASVHNCFQAPVRSTCTCARDCSPFELQYDLQELPASYQAGTGAATLRLDRSAANATDSFHSRELTHRVGHHHRPVTTIQLDAAALTALTLKLPAAASTTGLVQGCVSLDEALEGYQRCMEAIGQLPFVAALSE